jgi:hypothetical protein
MRLTVLAAAAVVFACGDSPSEPTPEMGTIFFRTDPVPCSSTSSITFFIENEDVGTETLAPGVLSVGYRTKASSAYPASGKPVVQGRFAQPGGILRWTYRENVILAAGENVTHTFRC